MKIHRSVFLIIFAFLLITASLAVAHYRSYQSEHLLTSDHEEDYNIVTNYDEDQSESAIPDQDANSLIKSNQHIYYPYDTIFITQSITNPYSETKEFVIEAIMSQFEKETQGYTSRNTVIIEPNENLDVTIFNKKVPAIFPRGQYIVTTKIYCNGIPEDDYGLQLIVEDTLEAFELDVLLQNNNQNGILTKHFTCNDVVYLNPVTDIDEIEISATIQLNSETVAELDLPGYFYPSQPGNYQITIAGMKPGYADKKISYEITVFEDNEHPDQEAENTEPEEDPAIPLGPIIEPAASPLDDTRLDGSSLSAYPQKNEKMYGTREVFLVENTDWHEILKLVPLTTWYDSETDKTTMYPTMIFHKEEDLSTNTLNFDADAIIRFLEKYQASRVTIIGCSEQEPNYGKLIFSIAQTKELGVNLPMQRLPSLDNTLYKSYWKHIDKIVISTNDYSTGLMAAVYASYLNAPLLFLERFDYSDIKGYDVITVGNIDATTYNDLIKHARTVSKYSLTELQKEYIRQTNTDKAILVNPQDLIISNYKHNKPYITENPYCKIYDLFGNHSMAAPFLAAAKQEVIITTSPQTSVTSKYKTCFEIDDELEEQLTQIDNNNNIKNLTIVANPLAIPMARLNRDTYPAVWQNRVIFEEFNVHSLHGNPLELRFANLNSPNLSGIVVISDCNLGSPAIYKDNVVYEMTYKNNRDIWISDLSQTTHNFRKVTQHSADQRDPDIYGNHIVWEDKRNGNWDIYGAPANSSGVVSWTTTPINIFPICTNNKIQKNPAIYDKKVVYEDNRNGNWDIYLYNIGGYPCPEQQITSSTATQRTPDIWDQYIVYGDNRNGNWDIYLYDLAKKQEAQITTNQLTQINPRICGNYIVWQDNRNGNWDIYAYDISKGTETQITYSNQKQYRPDIHGDTSGYKIIFYSDGYIGATPPTKTQWTKPGHWFLTTYTFSNSLNNGTLSCPYQLTLTHDYAHFHLEVDTNYYGSKINDTVADRAVGRIFGVTVSDVSAYIARNLFINALLEDYKATLIIPEDGSTNGSFIDKLVRVTSPYWSSIYATLTTKFGNALTFYAGLTGGPNPIDSQKKQVIKDYLTSLFIIFYGHGNERGLHPAITSSDFKNQSMPPSFIFTGACATNSVGWGYVPRTDLFSMQNLRYGAMNYMGAVDMSYWHRLFQPLTDDIFVNNLSVGNAFRNAKNKKYLKDSQMQNIPIWLCADGYHNLLGDPTLKPTSLKFPSFSYFCWGKNNSSQLGNVTTTQQNTPALVKISNIKSIKQISAGENHTLALTNYGDVYAWGDNTYGQLGIGSTCATITTPTKINLFKETTITKVAAGGNHSLAISKEGRLFAWGNNQYGQVGDETYQNKYSPVEIKTVKIMSSYNNSYWLYSNNTSFTNTLDIAAGYNHSLAIIKRGSYGQKVNFAWGHNNFNQIEPDITYNLTKCNTPRQISTTLPSSNITAGKNHSIFYDLYCAIGFGDNSYGQLGNNKHIINGNCYYYYIVKPGSGILFPGISCPQIISSATSNHTLVLDQSNNNRLHGCGENTYGQLGIDPGQKKSITVLSYLYVSGLTSVAAGRDHTLVLTRDNKLYTLGLNDKGQLGDKQKQKQSYKPIYVQCIDQYQPLRKKITSGNKTSFLY